MFDKVAKLLAEQLGLPVSKITPESRIVEDLGADSLDVVELLMTLEDETGKTIPAGSRNLDGRSDCRGFGETLSRV